MLRTCRRIETSVYWPRSSQAGVQMERGDKPALALSRRTLLGTALAAPFGSAARAQAYPTRNPHIIVPFAAGGPTDVLTRIAADRVSPSLGQKIVVESRAGAGGNLAAETVLRAEA